MRSSEDCEALHEGGEVRGEGDSNHSSSGFPCFIASGERFSLHKGFGHKRSLKTTALKDGCLWPLVALTLHDCRWRHERRMDAGKDTSERKRNSCYK